MGQTEEIDNISALQNNRSNVPQRVRKRDLTPSEKSQRRLTLFWGVTPVIVRTLKSVEDFFDYGASEALKLSPVSDGDNIILVAGVPIGVPGGTNLLYVLSLN